MPSRETTSPTSPDGPTPLAAIDIGSNSFRVEIGQLEHGRYRRIDYLKETVRLGAGLDAEGMLSDDAAERGLACLARFARRLEGFEPWQVRAVATQTLREARNRDAFLARAQAALGRPIEVISGREEARLIYAGVARLQPSNESRLVVDIGGRSTEMILGVRSTPHKAESFAVGSVSLSLRYFPDGRYTADRFRRAQIAAGAEFEEARETFVRSAWTEAMGASGTVAAVSQILSANRVTDGRITPDALRWLMEQCLEAASVDQLTLAGLKEDRRPVIAGGLCILYTLAAHFDIESLKPARGALRQGVIFDLHDRHESAPQGTGRRSSAKTPSMRDRSVQDLQRRFEVDTEQAARVERAALSFYAAVQPEATPEARRELAWAARLHELGMMVSHHDHHRHSGYLLSHVDAAGFSQSQLRRLAALVLAQRGGLRKVEPHLAEADFAWQVLCLRLAVIQWHARNAARPLPLQLRATGSKAMLDYDAPAAAEHPMTLHLLQEEAASWERCGPLRLEIAATEEPLAEAS